LINNHLAEQGIALRQETELEEIIDDSAGRVKAIKQKVVKL